MCPLGPSFLAPGAPSCPLSSLGLVQSAGHVQAGPFQVPEAVLSLRSTIKPSPQPYLGAAKPSFAFSNQLGIHALMREEGKMVLEKAKD